MSDKTTCAIVGGGPAGLFLGLLLARAGVEVTVLEKHANFLRDFRGDTVHPVTMRLLDELGLFEKFEMLPHTKVEKAQYDLDGHLFTVVDFRRLRQPHPYVAMVPQWDLLDLIADAAKAEPTFTLRVQHEVTGLVRDGTQSPGCATPPPMGTASFEPTWSSAAMAALRSCAGTQRCRFVSTRCRSTCGGFGCPATKMPSTR